MQITRSADHDSRSGNSDYFTGTVTLEPVPTPDAPARLNAARVTFGPGARTFWHTHPLGQTLLVLSGTCLAQTDGGAVMRLDPGDTVFFAPGEKHWHGAGPDAPMTHLAMQEAQDGSAADWLEEVTDAQYAGN
ncbi:cupin domain-containing protein [Thalassococcus profundi]|uniref:Cupin domain-containing protein n=1 Tax=Thalassococcus profundi TaxID=2282382 RepID=A0A369TJV6_9RHOB|nr:cupin domain-containing protein [Thalassococcus profundi]RDD65548.1 cupin domain-containing protein [Thalassococcus profundi]